MSWFTIVLSFWSSLVKWFPWKKKQTGTQSKTYLVNDFHFPGNTAHKTTRNKAYVDQHQKATHNRRRKPKKAMRNLYHL